MPFQKGQSGNPQGRRAGAIARVTVGLRELVAKDAKAIVKSVIELAKAGDVESRRVFMRHLLPQSSWPTPFDLPKINGPADLPRAVQAAIDAAASGELGLEAAERVVALLTGLRQAYESADLAERLNEMEARLAALTAQAGTGSGQ